MPEVEVKEIGPHIEILSGFAFPSSRFSTERGTPLIRIRDLESQTTEALFDGPFDPRYIVRNGDVLVGMDGDFNAIRWTGGNALLNQRVCKITSVSDELDDGYLFHWLQPRLDEIHRKTPQTTVRHLSTGDMDGIKLPFFSPPEQRRIAAILDTADEAIGKTEALIGKLKQMKAGLLHDLLTGRARVKVEQKAAV